jgi:hypothetical protein
MFQGVIGGQLSEVMCSSKAVPPRADQLPVRWQAIHTDPKWYVDGRYALGGQSTSNKLNRPRDQRSRAVLHTVC